MPTKDSRRVSVIAFDGVSPFHLSVPCLVFGEDRSDTGVPRYAVEVCAAEAGPITTTAGFSILAPVGLAALSRADMIIVPSWRDPFERPPKLLLDALVKAHRRGATVVGLCLGAFVLAEAGLLDDRRATTHWRWASTFAQRFPSVHLDPAVLYVDEENNAVTSAGTVAGIDCCLHLLRKDVGAELANQVARRLVVAPHREGDQAQYIVQPMPDSSADQRLARVLSWVDQHLAERHTLNDLAARAAMSRRSFTRHFRQATASNVGPWLLSRRLEMATRMLETTDISIDAIADTCGIGSTATLRMHFAAAFKMSPTAYRRRFSQS